MWERGVLSPDVPEIPQFRASCPLLFAAFSHLVASSSTTAPAALPYTYTLRERRMN